MTHVTHSQTLPVIIDTDANNEIDDQHAIAYVLLNKEVFDVKGITVNATYNGGNIDQHFEEAHRVAKLCGAGGKIPVLKGADQNFEKISPKLNTPDHDGNKAVDFIISEANKIQDQKLVLLAIGKLTNVALALKKDPGIMSKIRLVWLGSNYPQPGEYNLENDIGSMNYILNSKVLFEMVTVRYGESTGTDAVKLTKNDARKNIAGRGPRYPEGITGRHGGTFYTFGDYAMDLFEHIDYYGNPPSRSLFDMAAAAIIKNPEWGHSYEEKGLYMEKEVWKKNESNQRVITIWENFDKENILLDFYNTLNKRNQ
ncbi:nucleoside hydrolase [Lutimonas saemankumensis]|uniref:nucleoside hydrolase n=1 Tax=Lutimonas saemankumensis TaxID=483016 RepID=UPI001CD4E007|nr:nucleoside hydrolase [Lutimonas saemankumensis]MCA0933403.1 nucleoside hydrolase [Lutimonas saemankumensis]